MMDSSSSSSSSLPPRRRLPDDDDDLEEGQFVPTAYQQPSDTDDDDAHPPHGHYRHRRLTLEELLALGRGDALPSPTPSCESDGTISDDRGGNNPSPASVFRAEPNRVVVALDGGWAATGRRGWTRSKLFSATAAPPVDAQSSHSNVSGDSSGGVHAVIVHQPPAPPLPYADQAPQLVHHQPPAAQHQQQQVPRPVVAPRRDADRAQREYTCKFCGKSYTSHQALGGHVAKHKSSQREAAAAAAAAGMAMPLQNGGAFLAALRRARREAEAPPHHQCRKCHKVFATGVALGGHMRVHYTGPPIVPARRKNRKRGLAPLAAEDVIAAPPPTGLSLALPIKAEEAPSSAAPPAGAGRVVRLFGIDISPKVQAPSAEQQCSGTTTEEFSAAGGQQ
ncbi:hypothetical protein C2845_PM17G01080 [Panicum miliaceum]|uniref:C2H2-type domain-containing protein n=1 Tax=Panicum miliaceum TaxID=4540 RepID=A0A3L6Q202_PANMI|nr:hypothetical protein C2845_PM17G01080 [Panicum miliaceum]